MRNSPRGDSTQGPEPEGSREKQQASGLLRNARGVKPLWKISTLVLILILILIINSSLYSAGTYKWKITDYQQFNKGKLTKVKLNEDGILTLAPGFNILAEIDAVFVWDIKEDSKGNIFLATGNNGIIYKITPDGKMLEFFKTSSIAAFKILIDKNDNLYAATMTKGLIYKISPKGNGSIFTVFSEEYIWDMKFYKGNILLATGTPGSLYELNLKTKKLNEVTLTKEMHIICMDIDNNNNIYFGTSDKGAVYKLSEAGELKIIYQTQEKEIHSIAVNKKSGIIYAGTSDKEFSYVNYQRESRLMTPYKKETSESEKLFDDLKDFKKIKSPANAVYEIKENEYVNKVIESKNSIFLSLILDGEALYIGSGDKGIIYLYKNKKIDKLARLEEQQILSFYRLKNKKILFGTGNTGNIYKLDLQYAQKGTYKSKLLDAGGWAFWGNIQWDEKKGPDTDISVQTRSGNTEDVDDTWSDWSEEYTDHEGSKITSPDHRFLQFKIRLKTKNKKYTPEIYSITIPYLIKNRKPAVLSVTLLKNGNNSKTISKTSKSSYKKYSLKDFELKVKWDVKDKDKDSLNYELHTTLRNENEWLLLKDKIKEKSYTFDTRILPDGVYLFKVVADDIPSNSLSNSLKDEKISRPFIIDNTPPVIKLKYKKGKKNQYSISGSVTDNLSSIASISYSVDTKNWTSIFPDDRIFDSKTEKFQFNYKYEKGIVIIKTEDESGNIATSYVRIK